VLFFASWCPYCRSFLAVFEKHAAKGGFNSALRVKVDDYDNSLWDDYSIRVVPTVIFFDEGKVCRRLNGRLGQGLSEKQLKEWLETIQGF
jgi:thioredoxin-like negative regulator of GroEL